MKRATVQSELTVTQAAGGDGSSPSVHFIATAVCIAIVMDWVLRKTMDNSAGGIMWEGEDQLCDLDFADDIALIANTWSSMQQPTTALTVEVGVTLKCLPPGKSAKGRNNNA